MGFCFICGASALRSGILLNASHEERVLGGPKKQFVCPNECQKCCMMEENMGEWQCLVKKIFAGATAFLQRMAGYNCGDPEFFGPKETVITCRYESQTVDFAGDLEKFTADRKVLRRELKAVSAELKKLETNPFSEKVEALEAEVAELGSGTGGKKKILKKLKKEVKKLKRKLKRGYKGAPAAKKPGSLLQVEGQSTRFQAKRSNWRPGDQCPEVKDWKKTLEKARKRFEKTQRQLKKKKAQLAALKREIEEGAKTKIKELEAEKARLIAKSKNDKTMKEIEKYT